MRIAAWCLMTFGLFIMFFGALGTIILDDLFQRFHASTKCGVTGSMSILLGLILFAGRWDFALKFTVIIVFIVISEPMIAHIIALSRMEEHALDDTEDAHHV